ncbi:uncharacterized protein LOC133181209 [Saccostrea echinata]|uniref:uncharacterized protein LOC133181209 n=1 Tax=Saccostrea echinata TaxID=191078 RepID=UPI002A7FD2BF|nr:uncharacterized protein LOC133181209 [Saccostrea echinata]
MELWTFSLWIFHFLGTTQTFLRSTYFVINTRYKNVLPTSGLISTGGQWSLSACGILCASNDLCQTIFFKPLEKKCFLYMYSIWRHTQRKQESGVEMYEIASSCTDFGFVHNRAGGICFQIFWTQNITSTWAIMSCKQLGGSLISLDTDQKIGFVTTYIRNYYDFSTSPRRTFQIGLNNTQGPEKYTWKWSNGAQLSPNLSIPFYLNNYDGHMRSCAPGHCGVLSVKNLTTAVFDNCCLKVSFLYICSKDIEK